MPAVLDPDRFDSPILTDPFAMLDCPCDGKVGYCPLCGSYHPASTDLEIVEAVASSSRPKRVGRVIRKPLES